MRLDQPLRSATFVARLNRFAALMRLDGSEVVAHVPNSGRLAELLRPENSMLLAPAPRGSQRKTSFDLALVEVDGVLVSADARLPNRLLREAIEAGAVPAFCGYHQIDQEVVFQDSRLDLVLTGPSERCYIETKSVTLVEGGVGLFPDAPTARGTKHVLTLRRAIEQGHRGAVVFVIQRPDADCFSPNEAADPLFCETLRAAARHGLEVLAFRCDVSRSCVRVADAVPLRLGS